MPLSRPSFLASLVLVAACLPAGLAEEVTVQVDSEQSTLLWVSWATDEPSQGSVQVELDGGELIEAHSEATGTEHLVPLFGLPADTELSVLVHGSSDGGGWEQTVEAATGSLPPGLPALRVGTEQTAQASDEPYMLVGLGSSRWSGLLVVDRRGRIVWHHALEPDCYFVETGLLPDRPGALAMSWCGSVMSLHRVPFDPRHEAEAVELVDGHHAFAPLPDGGVVYCYEECRSWEHQGVGGEVHACGDGMRILEPDGSVSQLFSVWDWDEPPEGILRRSSADNPADWTHANAIDHHRERDTLLFSLRNLEAVLEVDLGTGEVVEEYGSTGASAGFAAGTEAFHYQHDPNWLDGDALLMVTTPEGEGSSLGRETYVVELALREGDGKLEERWSYHPGPNVYSHSGGGARRLENGNTLAHWRDSRARFREITPGGELAWELTARDSSFRVGTPQLFRSFYEAEEDD